MNGPRNELALGGEPRVQLLPPSVRERERRHAARRMMVLLVVLAVVVVGGGVAFGFLRAVQAEAALAAAQQQTLDILAQQAEFAQGAQVASLVKQTEAAQRQVTSTEIDWLALLTEISNYIPAGTTLAEVAFVSPAPWEPTLIPEGQLRAERIALVNLTLTGPDYVAPANFITAVRMMPGSADAVITGTTFQDGQYRTAISLALNADVLADRYNLQPEPATGDAGDDPAGASATQPEPNPTEGMNQ